MKQAFEITDQDIIRDMLTKVEYGTLALCDEGIPYSVPLNFVPMDGDIYFHSAKKGRKMDILKKNKRASFSVVQTYSLIPSYFSSRDGLACPATQFFKSIIMDGDISFIDQIDEKSLALKHLMEKLQPEGHYKPLSDEEYLKTLNSLNVYKLTPHETRAKFKFGQHVNADRFDMIIAHLEERGSDVDRATIQMMKQFRNQKG